MTKFRVSDPVRITHSPCRYFDMVGTVTDIAADQDHPFAVTGLEPWTLWFGPGELVLAERAVGDAQGGAVGSGGAVGAPVGTETVLGAQAGVQG